MLVLYVLFEERSYARALFEEYKTEAVNDLIHYNSVNKLNTGCGELSSLGANFYLFALLFYKTNRAPHILVCLAKTNVILGLRIPKIKECHVYLENVDGQNLVF